MVLTGLFSMLAVAVLAAAWLAVQLAWSRSFPGEGAEPDALARRGGCGDCAHPGPCHTIVAHDEPEASVATDRRERGRTDDE